MYEVEFQIANLNSQKATLVEQSAITKTLFNLLLNRDLNAEIIIDNNLVDKISLEPLSLKALQQQAFQNNLEIKQLSIAERANSLNQERIKKEGMPTLGVQGGIGVQGVNLGFDEGGPLYTIGLGLNWNVFDNGQRKKQIEGIEVEKICSKIINHKSSKNHLWK